MSQSIEREGALVEPFLQALLRELAHTAELLARSPCRIRTLYFGGGTPTILTADQLRRLMAAIASHFDLSRLIEYTVEGGRPDTLDAEKLAVLRAYGCGRVSINPQTMSDAVLRAVGRRHTTQDTVRAYEQARAAGFDAVNMDLIAGLPGDSAPSFADSLGRVLRLEPENITVHTLALKKGADLYQDRRGLPPQAAVAEMLAEAAPRLRAAGYAPYYLYRQKYMSGSFENVGWTRPGFDGLYNIYMMEELHTVLSLGGGGMNKVNLPGGRIVRFHNPKYPKEYLAQLDDVLLEKEEIFRLLGKEDGNVH